MTRPSNLIEWKGSRKRGKPEKPSSPAVDDDDPLAGKLADCDESDSGNAERFNRRYGENSLYVPGLGWHVYDGARWLADETETQVSRAQTTASRIHDEAPHCAGQEAEKRRHRWAIESRNRRRVQAMLAMAQPHLAKSADVLDQDIMLVNCRNGTFDLESGKLLPHERGRYITKVVLVPYDPAAECPTFLAFLSRIFAGNSEIIAFLQRALGYSLTGDVSEKVLFICHGQKGNNGKSTLFELISDLMGGYARALPAQVLLQQRHSDNGAETKLARLRGARFVTAIETAQDRRLAEDLVKHLTGGDRIIARFLYQAEFEFRPTFKIWLATNHKPSIQDAGEAMWRRIRLIPFTETIPDDEIDLQLPAKLRHELPGIFRWCLQGALAWRSQGLAPPDEVVKATTDYREEQDHVGRFLEACCQPDPKAYVTAAGLWNAYQGWPGRLPSMTQTRLGRELADRGFVKEKVGVVIWHGLSLRDVSDPGSLA